MNPNDPAFPVHIPKPPNWEDAELNKRYAEMMQQSIGLTKREYACISLGIAETGNVEIDGLIRKAERKRIAAKAMEGLLSNSVLPKELDISEITKGSVKIADALICALEKKSD